jgi:hypothetical protein
MHTFHIADPIYFQGVEILVGGDVAELQTYVREHTGEVWDPVNGDGAIAKTLTHYPAVTLKTIGERKHAYYIWFREWYGTPEEYGRMAHECYHHVVNVMQVIRCDDEEAFAYYLAHVVSHVVTGLEAWRRKQLTGNGKASTRRVSGRSGRMKDRSTSNSARAARGTGTTTATKKRRG